jgi:hypothetical protein
VSYNFYSYNWHWSVVVLNGPLFVLSSNLQTVRLSFKSLYIELCIPQYISKHCSADVSEAWHHHLFCRDNIWKATWYSRRSHLQLYWPPCCVFIIPHWIALRLLVCCGCQTVPLSSYSEAASGERPDTAGEAQMTISTSALCLHDPRQNCAMIVFCCGCRRVPLSSYSEIASIWRATWYSGRGANDYIDLRVVLFMIPRQIAPRLLFCYGCRWVPLSSHSEVASIWRATWYSGRGANDYINLRVVLSSSLHIDWRQNHCPAADVRRYHCLSVRDSIWRRPTTAEGVANDYCDLSAEFYHHWTSQAFKITFPLFAALIWWGVSLQVILVHLTLFILDAERANTGLD